MANQYLGVDPVLTNLSLAYKNEEYIADKIFKPVLVKKQSGKHFVYDQDRFRVRDAARSAGANSNEITIKLTTGSTYFCEDHALKQFVPDEDRDNAVIPNAPYADATENLSDSLLVAREKALADWMIAAANFTNDTTLSGTSQWSDYSNSDPFTDIETAKTAIHGSVFQKPNTLILGKQAYDKLKNHPDLLDRVKYSQKGVLTVDLLKELFDVSNVLIGAAGYNTATEGQTDSMGYIWGKNAWLAYIAPTVAQKMVTFGLTFSFKTRKVERLRGTDEEDRKGTYIRIGNEYWDQAAVTELAAYLIKDCVA